MMACSAVHRAKGRENVRAGLRRAKETGTKSGKPIGRPTIATEDEAHIRYTLARGIGYKVTAAACGVSLGTVQRIVAMLRLSRWPPTPLARLPVGGGEGFGPARAGSRLDAARRSAIKSQRAVWTRRGRSSLIVPWEGSGEIYSTCCESADAVKSGLWIVWIART
jgi:hypothetical protein